MSDFFICCVKCQRTFTDREVYEKHLQTHGQPKAATRSVPEKAGKPVKPERNILSDEEQDTKLARIRELNAKRKKLINMGIEAQTMKPEEVEARYAEEMEKAKGE